MMVNINDLRQAAQRRLPRAVFDYVDGGAEDEATLRNNRLGFERYTFNPRVLVDVSQRDQSTTVLGQRLTSPLILAPTGFSGMLRHRGEALAAHAAAQKGVIYTCSTMSICSMEEIAAASGGPLWFQLYVWRDREITRSLIDRAQVIGARALVVTVDTPVLGQREKDLRNGLIIPPRVTLGNLLDLLRRPAWLREFLSHPRPTFGNFVGAAGVKHDAVSLGAFTQQQFSAAITWDDLDWFRSIWNGPLAIKGVMSAADARLAVEHGVDAIVVSNHGGRQSDYLPGAIDVLPEVVDAVAGQAEVILDGGVQRGSDVVKALALGAKACLIGKAFNYGLAAGGEAGASRAIEILQDEIDRCLALLGCPTLADLDRTVLRGAAAGGQRTAVPVFVGSRRSGQ
jgi:L-lactate dehydrogenase (cytochrome)